MKILFLTPELPWAPGGPGGATRQFHVLRRLTELGHRCVVVAPVLDSDEERANALEATGVTLHRAHRTGSRLAEAAGAVLRRPALLPAAVRKPVLAWQVDVFWTAMRPLVERAITEESFDVLHVEHDWAADWGSRVALDAKRVLTLQNLSWEYYEARAPLADPVRAAALRVEAHRFRRFDRRFLDDYDLLVALSKEDAAATTALTGLPCESVPVGIDAASFVVPPAGTVPAAEPVVLFTGHLGWAPNREAVAWLLKEVWPRIRARRESARLLVVGRHAPEELIASAGDGVEFAGYVPDIRDAFARASVVVVPILSGSGVRLKLIDGIASGRPVVATPLGAQGFDVVDGEHLLIAEGAAAFAETVVRVLDDPALARRLGDAGRKLAEDVYDWNAIGDRFAAMLERAVNR